MVVRSHSGVDDWNAIDPNLAVEKNGHQWLVFGSFWGGLKMKRINPTSGMLDTEDDTLYSLAQRSHEKGKQDAIEAPFLIRHERFYYLFASFDFCCRGVSL